MCRARPFQYIATLYLLLFFRHTIAIELRPIRPVIEDDYVHRLGKRGDISALDLRSSETFFWGGAGPSDAIFANFTVYMPGEFENIVTMERFYGMLKSVNCTDHDMTLTFNDDATFAYAQRVWDWVNGADNHTFVMIAGVGDCEWNKHRQPLNVSTITYDEVANVARLKAKQTSWKTIAHSYDLDVGHVAKTDSRLSARDLPQNVSLDISRAFPFQTKITKNGLATALECANCTTSGKLNLEFKVSQRLLAVTGASVIISPRGVSAKAEIKLTESGKLTEAIEFEKSVLKIPLNPIKIPGVVDIGPNLEISVGFAISSLEGSASVSTGAIASLQESAIVELNFLDPLSSKSSGWVPDVKPLPVVVDAKISGGLQIYAMPAVTLGGKVLGFGFEIGLDLKMPYIDIKAEAIFNQAGVCDTNKSSGVEIGAKIGAELAIKAANVNTPTDELLDLELATIEVPVRDKRCFPFGGDSASAAAPPAAGPAASPPPSGSAAPPPSSVGSQPSDPGSSAGNSCKSKNGLGGTCISTSACSGNGGSSEPGHCPGGDDIQCCTVSAAPPSSGVSCKVKSGLSGECMSTGACSQSGGQSEAGHCSGDEDIQCCTHSETSNISKTPSSSGACKIHSGLAGQCMPTGECSNSGGQSEAGHCPGPKDIQCCTHPTNQSSDGDQKLSDDDDDDDTGSNDDDVDKGSNDDCDDKGSNDDDDDKGSNDGDNDQNSNDDDDDDQNSNDEGSCKIGNGTRGTCNSTADCSSSGGTSGAGHCPGAADIQCCRYESCNVEGKKGQCQSTPSCSGTSTPGYCPSPDNIQCCTS